MTTSPSATANDDTTTPYEDLGGLRDGSEALTRPDRCAVRQMDEYAPPCRACKAAREAHETAQREQARAAAAAERREREEQARLRSQEIDRCPLCDVDGYVVESTGVRVCYHDPEAAERAHRGADQCRRVLSEATA